MNVNLVHQNSFGRGYSNLVSVIPHSECSVTDEVELITSTQYVMSGSTSVISKENGAVQVRSKVETFCTIFIDVPPIAGRRPIFLE